MCCSTTCSEPRVNFVGRDSDFATELGIVADAARARGGRPYVIPIGGSTPVGALGYVACGQELLAQAAELGVVVDAVVHCSGSGGTQAGLLNGLHGSSIPVIGISCAAPSREIEATVLALANATAEKLGSAVRFKPDSVEVIDDYVGPGYGVPTPEMLEALELCARLEGLLLDPVYTGKAMAGLIGLVRRGRFKPTHTISVRTHRRRAGSVRLRGCVGGVMRHRPIGAAATVARAARQDTT